MPIGFEAPRWLWLLLPCGPVVWLVALLGRWKKGLAGWTSAVVRGLLVMGLVLAAARPVRLTKDRAVSAVALFDVSASISDEGRMREWQLAKQLAAMGRSPHELRSVCFASTPTECGDTSDASDGGWDAGADTPMRTATNVQGTMVRPRAAASLATDIARALGLAAGLGDPTRARRVLLVSDGRATTGDALAQAAQLAARGIRLNYVSLSRKPSAANAEGARVANAEAIADVAIAGFSAPATIRPHATFPLRVDIATDRPERVRLTMKRNDAPVDPRHPARTLALPAGKTSLTWDARVDDEQAPSVFVVDAQLLDQGDAHPENNRALLAISPPKAPRALVLSPRADDAAPLIGVLRAQSIQVQAVSGGGGGSFDAALSSSSLARVDMMVLCDLPRAALGDDAIEAIGHYVRDGGGLLVTGGPHAFGPGGWGDGRLESLWPVRMDLPRRQDEPALALALVIDRSGSMSGTKMELTKQAALGTAEMLPADDQIAVIAFDSQATTIVPLQRAANRLRIATNIGRIQATGGTNILLGLREAVEQLGIARAKKRHVILLSDGQSSAEGIAEMVDAAAGAQITISTVSVGDTVDDALLAMIARQGGGRAYHTRDPASIPRIFTRETSEVTESAIIERPTSAHARKRDGMLTGMAWNEAPRLRGYVRTRPRAQAELLLATDAGDPLLARWPVGLGQVAAWTSDLGVRWADDWTRWPSFAQLWGQVSRTLMRPQTSQEFPLTARATDGVVEVDVEALAADDTFLAGLEGFVDVTPVWSDGTVDSGPPQRVALTEDAPGRYGARFPIAAGTPPKKRTMSAGPTAPGATIDPAALVLRAVLSRGDRPIAQGSGHVSIPLVPELLPMSATSETAAAGTDLLAALAASTGGGALASPADLFRGAPTRTRRRPLRGPLLGGLALLFVADVALRRLILQRTPRRTR